MRPLDEIDRQILTLVQRDAKLSLAEIGHHTGLAVSSVLERLRKLAGDGVIRGYHARVDPESVGLHFCAFMQVSIDRPENEQRFLEKVLGAAEVLEVHHVTGDYSYLLKLRLRGPSHMEDFLRDVIKPARGVARTHTMVALSTPKETSEVAIYAPAEAPAKRRLAR